MDASLAGNIILALLITFMILLGIYKAKNSDKNERG